jgi:hypothetical protein
VEPLRVWKVELAKGLAAHDVAGALTLGEEHLVFTPDDGGAAQIPYGAIDRVKRLRMTAVIVVRWLDGDELRETAFFATRPPPLHRSTREAHETEVRVGKLFPTTRRMQQRRNSAYLAEMGTELKPVLKAWTVEIVRRTRA